MIADGATGTMFIQWGLSLGTCTEVWNLEHHDLVQKLAKSYIEAGSDLIETNTFGASPLRLSAYGLAHKMKEINELAIDAAQRARAESGRDVYIIASCGPCGHLLTPIGDVTPQQVLENYIQQMNVLASAGIDAFCIETMCDLNEAILAIQAAKTVNAHIPIFATMSFTHGPRGFFTTMGASIKDVVSKLPKAGADVIGANCGNGSQAMLAIADEFRRYNSKIPLLIKPNAGLPQYIKGQATYLETPEIMADYAMKLVELKVNIIGGCCGTTPDHIKELRRRLPQNFSS